MKKLLEFYLEYFDFLYTDPRYRFTDSRTEAPNASVTVAGPDLTWVITVDRGLFELSVSPTRLPGDGFWISLIRQYIGGSDDIDYRPAVEEIDWARDNLDQIVSLFADASRSARTSRELANLRRKNGEKLWGPRHSTS